jgi:hypothetical protein
MKVPRRENIVKRVAAASRAREAMGGAINPSSKYAVGSSIKKVDHVYDQEKDKK